MILGNLFDHILPASFVLYQHHKVFKSAEILMQEEDQKGNQEKIRIVSPTTLNTTNDELEEVDMAWERSP